MDDEVYKFTGLYPFIAEHNIGVKVLFLRRECGIAVEISKSCTHKLLEKRTDWNQDIFQKISNKEGK